MARMVNCIKLGREAEGLDYPPYPGDLGKQIWRQVSKEAWQQWLQHQTMLINHHGISPMDPQARKFLEGEMQGFFFGAGSDIPEGYTPPEA
jgi:Fe-S cluster biosynthesis and repair protein YggX